jgi:two-component system nitrogen regulation sensor histidine kinase NtrY
MMEQAKSNPNRIAESEIQIQRDGRPRTLLLRLASEGEKNESRGFVITFDDITDLISVQRKAAWSDVARRLAHEIKNPLTPIQLAAERLRRRYLDEVKSDPQTFSTCIDTIIRQVEDIGNMINEFSAFARIPSPSIKAHDVGDMVRRAVFLQRSANPEITYDIDLPEEAVNLPCDDRQVGQCLTNLLQNAADSIQAKGGAQDQEGRDDDRIAISVKMEQDHVNVSVIDNGVGLPKNIDRDITDPYVTTRTEGTGLGLAIVRKIMEDHGGTLTLEDLEKGGASISLVFPAKGPENQVTSTAQMDSPEDHGR